MGQSSLTGSLLRMRGRAGCFTSRFCESGSWVAPSTHTWPTPFCPAPAHPPVCSWQVRSGDLAEPLELGPGDEVTFTIVEGADGSGHRISGENAGCGGPSSLLGWVAKWLSGCAWHSGRLMIISLQTSRRVRPPLSWRPALVAPVGGLPMASISGVLSLLYSHPVEF